MSSETIKINFNDIYIDNIHQKHFSRNTEESLSPKIIIKDDERRNKKDLKLNKYAYNSKILSIKILEENNTSEK